MRALTDRSGTIVQSYQYDEYGSVLSSSGSTTQPFQYTGEQRDAESGFIYLRARMYDPYLNRFIQSDPIVANSRDSLALNRYIYGLDNPLRFTDPSGLSSQEGSYENDCFKRLFKEGGYALNAQCIQKEAILERQLAAVSWIQIQTPLGTVLVPNVSFAKGYGPNDTVGDILKGKKGSIKNAPLPKGFPGWERVLEMTWKEIEEGAKARLAGFQEIRKLLTDSRFDR